MNKIVKIKIQLGQQTPIKLVIRGGLFRKVSLEMNGKFQKFYSLTKIINRIRKLVVDYFK